MCWPIVWCSRGQGARGSGESGLLVAHVVQELTEPHHVGLLQLGEGLREFPEQSSLGVVLGLAVPVIRLGCEVLPLLLVRERPGQ
jgi:hypothetical protein